jgi:glycosyltransferase involved in cell wall biosynthesis
MPAVHLTIVGDGGFRQSLEQLARGSDVSFVGYQRDPFAYMSKADLFIMPSLGPEGSSLAALEAMASGVPCILSDLPVYLELTASREAAVHFRCGDVSDLAEKIKLVLGSETLRATLSRNASLLLKENFSPDKARDAYIQALEITPIQEKIAR